MELDKDSLKDHIIITLIDFICDMCYKNESSIIKKKIKNKLKQLNIVNIDIDTANILEVKDNILKIISNEMNIVKETELIGNGGYSNVYKIFNKLDNKHYAIKKIGYKNNFNNVIKEVRSMAILNHVNIVRYHTCWIESSDINTNSNNNILTLNNSSSLSSDLSEYDEQLFNKFICIQMELCKSNLKTYLLENTLTFNDKINICKQIILGLNYIHSNNLIHRDLKLQNILVGFDNSIKISDFGLANNIYDIDYKQVGTIGYIAPEVLKGDKHSIKSDLYSLGIIILEVFKNFKTAMEKQITLKEIDDNKLIINDDKYNKIITSLIDKNPDNRVSLDDILKLI